MMQPKYKILDPPNYTVAKYNGPKSYIVIDRYKSEELAKEKALGLMQNSSFNDMYVILIEHASVEWRE